MTDALSKILLLFDIDGTLIHAGGAGSWAMTAAFAKTFGVPEAFRGVEFAGGTDSQIVDTALRHHHINISDGERRFKSEYYRLLSAKLPQSHGRILPGVSTLLEHLSGDPRFSLALATGNYRESAYLKLSHFGLQEYFPVGGFAEDGHSRVDILRAAQTAARNWYNLEEFSSLFIADTVQDVEAARQCPCPIVCVATGKFSLNDLQGLTPHALPSLNVPSLPDWLAAVATGREPRL